MPYEDCFWIISLQSVIFRMDNSGKSINLCLSPNPMHRCLTSIFFYDINSFLLARVLIEFGHVLYIRNPLEILHEVSV